MDVESELALHGYADPSTSLFRGCHLCFLPLDKPHTSLSSDAAASGSDAAAVSTSAGRRLFQSTVDVAKAAAATQEALLDCQAKRVSLQVGQCACVRPCHAIMQSSLLKMAAMHS